MNNYTRIIDFDQYGQECMAILNILWIWALFAGKRITLPKHTLGSRHRVFTTAFWLQSMACES